MRMIKKVSDAIRHNIFEAKEKIGMAYRLRDEDKAVADWYKEMAAAHLAFNGTGHTVVTKLIDHAKEHMHDNPMLPGMMAVYNEIHADLKKEAAEVQAMIQNYK
jgi:hypothetical protein